MVFHFRHFDVKHDDSLLKVGTDAVLLGASIQYKNKRSSGLDIGTGCGVIALMMAQRFPGLMIDAIEPDPASFSEADFNFNHSGFSSQLKAICTDLQSFVAPNKYGLIFSNPPYFETPDFSKGNNKQDIRNARRAAATRHTLNFDVLLEKVSELLEQDGAFWVILPYLEAGNFERKAALNGLLPAFELNIKSKEGSQVIRKVVSFERSPEGPIITRDLTLYNSDNSRHESYHELTSEFYL
jgi:tRNA1Val (adenine37-N6)-methyltransferase